MSFPSTWSPKRVLEAFIRALGSYLVSFCGGGNGILTVRWQHLRSDLAGMDFRSDTPGWPHSGPSGGSGRDGETARSGSYKDQAFPSLSLFLLPLVRMWHHLGTLSELIRDGAAMSQTEPGPPHHEAFIPALGSSCLDYHTREK